jgi:hypothetical protein
VFNVIEICLRRPIEREDEREETESARSPTPSASDKLSEDCAALSDGDGGSDGAGDATTVTFGGGDGGRLLSRLDRRGVNVDA